MNVFNKLFEEAKPRSKKRKNRKPIIGKEIRKNEYELAMLNTWLIDNGRKPV